MMPHAVAEPVGAAPLERLPDRRQPERLAGVDGEVVVLPLEVLEGVEVAGGREARLGAGDVEADDALVAVARWPVRRSPATGRRAASRSAARRPGCGGRPRGRRRSPSRKPSLTASTTSSRRQSGLQVLLGRVADLGVDDAVGRQVLGALGGDPDQRLAGLHHRAGVGEGLQVAFQRAGVGRLAEPGPSLSRVGLGQAAVADVARRVRRRCRGAVRRRGGRAAAPWGRGGSARGWRRWG